MKKRFLSYTQYAVAVVLATLLWVEVAHALTVKVNNRGEQSLYISFVYTAPSGERRIRGWWKVDAGGSRSINLGNGYNDHFGKTFAFHATRGKAKWGNGSGGEHAVTSNAFNYSWATGTVDGDNPRNAKFTKVTYSNENHTINFN